MIRLLVGCVAAALAVTAYTSPAAAQGQPMFATRKIEGTENVYLFRYQGHQAMFIVTPAGVIATDPIGYLRPEAVKTYIAEIKKVTDKPIKYVIYSHHHYDHIAGGKPFKDLGAQFIAHRLAKQHLLETKNPDVVIPDEVVGDKKTITLGGTTLELIYVGRNHSDNSLVMRLPKITPLANDGPNLFGPIELRDAEITEVFADSIQPPVPVSLRCVGEFRELGAALVERHDRVKALVVRSPQSLMRLSVGRDELR